MSRLNLTKGQLEMVQRELQKAAEELEAAGVHLEPARRARKLLGLASSPRVRDGRLVNRTKGEDHAEYLLDTL